MAIDAVRVAVVEVQAMLEEAHEGGYIEGRDKGYDEGYADGYEKGYEEGLMTSKTKGILDEAD